MKRVVLLVTVAGLLLSGCGAKKEDTGEGSSLNVPGKGGGGTAKTADLNMQEKLFRDHYVAQCQAQLSQSDSNDTGKTPEEICNCVADRAWGMSKHAASSNEELDPMAVQREMMACMGIEMKAPSEEMFDESEPENTSMRGSDPAAAASAQNFSTGDAEAGPPEIPAEYLGDEAQEPPRKVNRNYKYDPKTKSWSN